MENRHKQFKPLNHGRPDFGSAQMRYQIRVKTDKPYDVVVGSGVVSELSALVPQTVERVALLHAPHLKGVAELIASEISATVIHVELPDAEAAKSAEVLMECWQKLGEAGFTRSDLVLSLGGGATTDLAGFVAATWLRGISVIHIPTTLLAMVDAAVGGKTGINTAAGKNLVGSFYHPTAVLCDLDFLQTLPDSEIRQGLAEIVKCGFIAEPKILDLLDTLEAEKIDVQHPALVEAAALAIQVKADVVSDDFTESKAGGLGREILNYGHTLGHAIENYESYSMRHGMAISIGMMFVAELAFEAGLLSKLEVEKHREILTKLQLPVVYSASAWPALLSAMAIDKKARGSQLRFVVLKSMQQPQILTAPDHQMLQAAYSRISED
jgi:3-dehydroquinate synthase